MAPPSPEKRSASADGDSPAKKSRHDLAGPLVATTTASSLILGSTGDAASQLDPFSKARRIQDALDALKNNNLNLFKAFLHPNYSLYGDDSNVAPMEDQVAAHRTAQIKAFARNMKTDTSYLSDNAHSIPGLDQRYHNVITANDEQQSAEAQRLARLIANSDFDANTCDEKGISFLSHAILAKSTLAVTILLRDPRANLYEKVGAKLGFWPYKLALESRNLEIIALVVKFYKKQVLPVISQGQTLPVIDPKAIRIHYMPWPDMDVADTKAIESVRDLLNNTRVGIGWVESWFFTNGENVDKFDRELSDINQKLIPELLASRDTTAFIEAVINMASLKTASSYLVGLKARLVAVQALLQTALQVVYKQTSAALVPRSEREARLVVEVKTAREETQGLRSDLKTTTERLNSVQDDMDEAAIKQAGTTAATLALTDGQTGNAVKQLKLEAEAAERHKIALRKEQQGQGASSSSNGATNGLHTVQYRPAAAGSTSLTPTINRVRMGEPEDETVMQLDGQGSPSKRKHGAAFSNGGTGGGQ